MELKELNEELNKIQTELVRQVLDGEKTENRIPHARPACIEKIIGNITGEHIDLDDFDTNGWEWDYSAYATIKDVTYRVGGDAYFNNSCSFSIDN